MLTYWTLITSSPSFSRLSLLGRKPCTKRQNDTNACSWLGAFQTLLVHVKYSLKKSILTGWWNWQLMQRKNNKSNWVIQATQICLYSFLNYSSCKILHYIFHLYCTSHVHFSSFWKHIIRQELALLHWGVFLMSSQWCWYALSGHVSNFFLLYSNTHSLSLSFLSHPLALHFHHTSWPEAPVWSELNNVAPCGPCPLGYISMCKSTAFVLQNSAKLECLMTELW